MRCLMRALQWRLLVLWAAVTMVPATVLTLPFWAVLGASFDYSAHGASLARELDLSTLADLALNAEQASLALGGAALAALMLTLLLSPFLSGMALHAARCEQAPGFAELTGGGARHYPRLLRMMAVGAIPFGLAALLGRAALRLADGYAESAILESRAELARLAAMALLALLLMLADASVDAGRAVLAADNRRTSALAAWWSGCCLVFTRPRLVLGRYLAISVAGLTLAALLSLLRLHVAPVGIGAFAGALLLTQAIVAVLGWMRAARLFALLEAARPTSAYH
ncbi:MAG: hypothetical protein ABIT83_07610 [Massilia sp.]